ncbi:ABC transporter permease [Paenibacillus roseipurpureus]|uniref:ABC transporter permease subunit n=1 Tax=Paenibacillus roseopurpureus TaxID=2918901 RepID=A0AA96LQH5_9BACL|nr:ABC transporter permease subunit [Paenibacillus sp. MBLB1832]WNR46140.1 ABC transporter permease subunit [Paenibacillus sp. MBLB1832]
MEAVVVRKSMDRKKTMLRTNTFHYLLMLAPGFIVIALINLLPMYGILIAFKHFNVGLGVWKSPWTGWENFDAVLRNPSSFKVIKNTLVIAVMKIIAGQIVPLAFALLLNEVRIRSFKRIVQTVVYLPHFLSWVILAGIIRDMLSLDGLINKLVIALGLQPIMFLGSNTWFRPIIILTDVWKEFGFAAIVYLAALTAINPSLYEAGDMDGATRMQKLRFITLPSLSPTIVLLATLSLQNVLNAGFDQVFNLYNNLVYDTGDIIDTYVYRMGLENLQYEIGTAVGLIKSVISMALIIIAYKLASKYANYRIF